MRNTLYHALFCALTLLVVTVLPASAATTNWDPAGINDHWFNANNWDNGLPDSGKDTFVDVGPASQINGGGPATARSLSIGTNSGNIGEVDVNGSSSLTVGVGALIIGDVGNGTLVLNNTSTTTASGAFFTSVRIS